MRAKQSRFPALPGGATPGGRGRGGCTNKANLPIAGCGSRIGDWGLGTELRDAPWALVPQGVVVQTNPIGRSKLCKTKPISPCGVGTSGTNRAKQSQFARERQMGQVLLEKGVVVNCTCISPWQNKANSRRYRTGRDPGNGGRAVSYKQSQFPRETPAGGESLG